MANIFPFKGIRFSVDKVGDLSRVIAPPYDIISPEYQQVLYSIHPQNIVRLILGKDEPLDNEANNKYTRARDFFKNWQDEGILIRDKTLTIYIYQQEYSLKGSTRKKLLGFIALTELKQFGSGVYPHEATLSGPKLDRLKLINACSANLCPIYSVYSDPEHKVPKLLKRFIKREADINLVGNENIIHKLWFLRDKEVINSLRNLMKDKPFFIADGHHRYETALVYRDLIRIRRPDFKNSESFNYIMMYFVDMENDNIEILPTHRIIKAVNNFNLKEFLREIKKYFQIKRFNFNIKSELKVRNIWLRELKNIGKKKHAFGFLSKGLKTFFLFELKYPNSAVDKFLDEFPLELKTLDVVILHAVIIKGILGIDQKEIDGNLIEYTKDIDKVISSVKKEDFDLAFVLNPTKIGEIKEAAKFGHKLPQKSTYFYPKPMSGLVLNILDPDEDVEMAVD